MGTEYWTNVYHVNVASLADALTEGYQLVDREKVIHHTNVAFDRIRVSAMPVSGGQFISAALVGDGLAPGPSDVPLFVVARVEWTVGFGRPGVKMYRGALVEADIVGPTALTPEVRSFYATWAAETLVQVPTLQKMSGGVFTAGVLSPSPGMRQLRRGSRRRTTPII